MLGGVRIPLLDGAEPDAAAPRLPPGPLELSPRMTAVFGGLFGLATVSSLVALLIHIVPPRNERALLASLIPSAGAVHQPIPSITKRKARVAVPGPWRIAELARDPSVVLQSVALERRSFIEALADKGIPKAQAYRILKAFDGVRKFDKTSKRDRLSVALDRVTMRVRGFEYEVSPSEIYQAREDNAGLLSGSRLDLKIAENEITGAFYVGKDAVRSYQVAGLEDGMLDTLDDALTGRISSESFEEGSTVRVIAVEETALGLFSRYKRIVAAEYRPADPAGKPTRVYYFTGQESRGYFDDRGRQPYAGGWRSPIPGAPVTSRFNPKRMHPVLKKIMPHQGTDLGAPMGTPVYSAYRGIVESVGPAGASGNLVTIVHPNGITTGYAHLSRFAPGIKPRDKVGTHQLVGYVGSTGRSTGPHLHFSAKKDGKFFDAETLDLDGERVMPGVDRAAFLELKAQLDKRLDEIALPEPPPELAAAEARPAGMASAGPAGTPGDDAGIHPSGFVEDDSEGDDEGGEDIAGPALGAPGAPSSGPAQGNPDSKGSPDPSEHEDDEEE